MSSGAAPVVDQQWVEYNPSHAGFVKYKLIHHHLNQGEVVTAVPQKGHMAGYMIKNCIQLKGQLRGESRNECTAIINRGNE